MGLFFASDNAPVLAKLTRIERKLDALLASLNITLSDDGLDDIRALAEAGKKIEAIKAYRERTGAGLKEAKDAVEQGL